MMKKTNLNLYLLFILFISIVSCTDDYFEFDKIQTNEWRPEFAIPIANSTLTLEEIVVNEDTSGAIVVGENNILKLVYEGNVLSNLGGERVDLPRLDEVESISNIPANPGQNTVVFKDTMNFSSNSTEVDSMILNAGEFVINFTSSGELPIEVNLKINGLIDDQGNSYDRTFFIPIKPANQNNSVKGETIQLDNYKVDMTLGGTSVNQLEMEYTININNNGSTQRLINELRMNTSLRNLNFKDFWGFIGTSPFDLRSDTFRIGVLRNAISGDIYLSNPTLELRIINSYGLPLDLDFDYLNAVFSNSVVEKIKDTLNNNFEDIITSLRFNLDGSPDTTLIVLNNKSNIDEVVSKLVKDIAYDSKAFPNPPASASIRNYVSDKSRIDLDVSLVMPLQGAVNNFEIKDTIDIELESAGELAEGELRTIVSNGFPLGVDLQLIFTNENLISIDTIDLKNSNGKTIPSAPVDPFTGKVNGRSDDLFDTYVSGERWNKLKNAKKLILRALMASTNVDPAAIENNTVSFEPENTIDISLGFKATINID